MASLVNAEVAEYGSDAAHSSAVDSDSITKTATATAFMWNSSSFLLTQPTANVSSAFSTPSPCSSSSLLLTQPTADISSAFSTPSPWSSSSRLLTQPTTFSTHSLLNKMSPTAAPPSGPTAQVVVEAGTGSQVYVGTLTGTALYTAISSAVTEICPRPTGQDDIWTCSNNVVRLPHDMDFMSSGLKGHLEVQVESSGYQLAVLYDAMVKMIALTAQNSAQGSSCGKSGKKAYCDAVGFVGVHHYNPFARILGLNTASWIDARWAWVMKKPLHSVGEDEGIDCDLIKAIDAGISPSTLNKDFTILGVPNEFDMRCTDSMTHGH